MKDVKVIALVGPTASGKTSLAIEIAKKYGGEVISVDSRQVYKGLDIGTEKVSKEEMDGVPHHMIDIVEPEYTLTVQEFQKLAREKIEEIISRKRLPILAGGSGQYMDAVLYDIEFPEVPPNEALRDQLGMLPAQALFKMLQDQDPARAETIDPHNGQRIIRALEIIAALGKVPSQKDSKILYSALYLGIDTPREELKKRIVQRLERTLEKGLIEEVVAIRNRVGVNRLYSFGLEYRVIHEYLEGQIRKGELEEKLTSELMGYAKRQMTWFKRNKDILWGTKETLLQEVEKFLG